jgi:hypothetical protein
VFLWRSYPIRFLVIVGSMTLMFLALAGGASAATPVPPFSQCPPVGVDTSCAILIVYNPDGSRVTLADPSQPPFDGIEDTLVGVQNNSSSTVSSTAITGVGIFSFDGDGLCSGVAPGNPPPLGCPYGPTRYEGRGSSTAIASTASGGGDSFTVVNANNGSVNFSPAIPPGGSAYFSLEGPAAAFCDGPTTVTLSPAAATNPVGTSHTVTATVRDACSNPVTGATVTFTITRTPPPNPPSQTCKTDASGMCSITYSGPILPATDAIKGCVGTAPCGTATKAWVLPVSNPLCTIDITQGGWIIANNGDKANFGGTAFTDNGSAPHGQEQYTDSPATLDVHSIDIKAITCSSNLEQADIYGDATINGSGNHLFRIEVTDPDSTGGSDTYWIVLDTGYDSGSHPLGGGHVEIHHT